MKPKQLEAACKKRGLESKGKKKELIKRLERYDSGAEPEPKKLSKKDDEPEVAKAAKAQLNKWMEKAKRESSKK